MPSLNRKATRTARSPNLQPPLTERLKAVVMFFLVRAPKGTHFSTTSAIQKGLHLHKAEETNTPSEFSHGIVVQPHGVILLHKQGYHRTQLYNTIVQKFFCSSKCNPGKASTLTHEGDVCGVNSPDDHRFDSSGLTLTFEGLLLRVSRRRHTEG
jgi:hypothetical protein